MSHVSDSSSAEAAEGSDRRHEGTTCVGTLLDALCRTERELKKDHGDIGKTLTSLGAYLLGCKRHQSPSDWAATVAECRAHPLRRLVHQDVDAPSWRTLSPRSRPPKRSGGCVCYQILSRLGIYRSHWARLDCGSSAWFMGHIFYRRTLGRAGEDFFTSPCYLEHQFDLPLIWIGAL